MTTTTTITDQPDLRTEAYKGDDTKRLIVIPLAQNLIGGVAVALLACIALYPLGMLARETVAASLAGGLAIACLVTIFRFFEDDVRIGGWIYKRGRASRDAEVQALKDGYEERVAAALSELEAERTRHRDTKREKEALEYTIRAMEVKGRYVPAEATEDPVYKDAHTLVDEWARRSYEAPTQRGMAAVGWTPQRYAMALSYLGSKGVVDRNGTKPRWLCDTKAEAVAMLEID